ncbi:hypothetical protein ACF09Y_24260 [Streptomyces massasporeus]|uniref:hypothetical protein n=1 Tax=Streptomyces massasporeus TaxID=67324 RepID=UPI0036F7FBFF
MTPPVHENAPAFLQNAAEPVRDHLLGAASLPAFLHGAGQLSSISWTGRAGSCGA